MNYRKLIEEKYILDNGYPNAKIINYQDKNYFTYYSMDEIPKGLPLADSVVLDEEGKIKYGFVKHFDGEEMRLITGYTGSGKSMRYLLQQLVVAIKAGQSAVVTDMSGQLIEYAYDILKKNNVKVYILNFANTKKSDTFNPFYHEAKKCAASKKILTSTEELIDAISKTIVHSKSTKDPSWEMGAKALWKGIIYGLFEELIEGTISVEEVTLYNAIQQFFWLREQVIQSGSIINLKEISYYKNKNRSSRSIQLMSPIAESAVSTRSGYFSVLCDNLSEINNEFMFDLTSSNTVHINDLWEQQTVLFINTGGKTAGDVVTSMFVQELYLSAMEESMKYLDKKLPRPIQLFLDEFANISFGDPNHFEKMLTTTRKMQIFFNMFIQNYTQIKTKLGLEVASTITSNSTEIFLGTKDYESRSEFAKSCGQRTVESLDSAYYDGDPRLISVDLISPEELLKIPKGTMYIVRNGYDLIQTQFEAAYNCKEFIPSKTFEQSFNDHRYNYESHLLLQPWMVKRLDLKGLNEKDLISFISRDEFDSLEEYLDDPKCCDENDWQTIKKLERMGLISLGENGCKTHFSRIKLAEAFSNMPREKKFNWDF